MNSDTNMLERVIRRLLQWYIVAADDECEGSQADCHRAIALDDAIIRMTGKEADQFLEWQDGKPAISPVWLAVCRDQVKLID